MGNNSPFLSSQFLLGNIPKPDSTFFSAISSLLLLYLLSHSYQEVTDTLLAKSKPTFVKQIKCFVMGWNKSKHLKDLNASVE